MNSFKEKIRDLKKSELIKKGDKFYKKKILN